MSGISKLLVYNVTEHLTVIPYTLFLVWNLLFVYV